MKFLNAGWLKLSIQHHLTKERHMILLTAFQKLIYSVFYPNFSQKLLDLIIINLLKIYQKSMQIQIATVSYFSV